MAGPLEIKGIAELVDRVTPVLRQISAGMRRVAGEQTFNRMSAQAKEMNRALVGVGSAMGGVVHAGGRIAGTVAALGVTFAGLQGAAMGFAAYTVRAFADAGGGLADLTAKTGMSVEGFQELRYAAEMVGVESDTLSGAMVKLNKTLADARSGKNKLAAEYFSRMGISLKNARLEDVIPKLAEAFRKNGDDAQRTAAAIALMGRGGAALIPMLIGGKKSLADMAAEARALGLIIPEADVAAADELGDNLDKLQKSVRGLGITIGAKLAPVIGPIIEDLLTWVKANREWLATGIADAIRDFTKSLREIDFKQLMVDARELFTKLDGYVQLIGGWRTVFIGLGTIVGASLISPLVSLAWNLGLVATAFGKIGWMAISASLRGVAAAMTGVAGAALLLPLALGGALIAGAIRNWDEFTAAVGRALGGLRQIFQGNIMEGFAELIRGNIDSVVAAIKGLVMIVGDLIGVDLSAKIAEGGAALTAALDRHFLGPFRLAVAAVKWLLDSVKMPSFSAPAISPPEMPPAPGEKYFRPPAAGPMMLPNAAQPQRTGSLLDNPAAPGRVLAAAQAMNSTVRGEATVNVRFANAPPGTQADTKTSGNLFSGARADMGYAMSGVG